MKLASICPQNWSAFLKGRFLTGISLEPEWVSCTWHPGSFGWVVFSQVLSPYFLILSVKITVYLNDKSKARHPAIPPLRWILRQFLAPVLMIQDQVVRLGSVLLFTSFGINQVPSPSAAGGSTFPFFFGLLCLGLDGSCLGRVPSRGPSLEPTLRAFLCWNIQKTIVTSVCMLFRCRQIYDDASYAVRLWASLTTIVGFRALVFYRNIGLLEHDRILRSCRISHAHHMKGIAPGDRTRVVVRRTSAQSPNSPPLPLS